MTSRIEGDRRGSFPEGQSGRPRVLIADKLPPTARSILQERGYEVVVQHFEPEQLAAAIGGFDAVIIRSATKIPRSALENHGRLRVIVRAGIGVDNVDIDAATEKGILVARCPEGNINAAAEHTVALALAAARKISRTSADLKEGRWIPLEGMEVKGKTWGIVGLGKVGSIVSELARGLRMKVVAHDPYLAVPAREKMEKDGVRFVGNLDGILKEADILSVHVLLTDKTRGMIGREELAKMKRNAIVINTARGGIIDESALAEALENGTVWGAGVDVFENEGRPEKMNRQLLGAHGAVVTPHLGASTAEAQLKVAEEAATQVITALENGVAIGAVNAPDVSMEAAEIQKPYLSAARNIAKLARGLAGNNRIKSVQLYLGGEFQQARSQYVQAEVINTLVEGISERRANVINYQRIAAERGIRLSEHRVEPVRGTTNHVQVVISHEGGQTEVSCGFIREQLRITSIDGFGSIELPLGSSPDDRYLLVVKNEDRPGQIGQVATFLGVNDVNINKMDSDNQTAGPGNGALMAFFINKGLSPEQLEELRQKDGISSVRLLQLQ